MTELKPCPFCGGKAELKQIYTIREVEKHGNKAVKAYEVICPNSDCIIYNADNRCFFTRQEAAKAWNKRTHGWISVKERLPEDGENVLVFARNIHIGNTADIAKLFRGISKEEREKKIESGDKRGQYYYPEDEWGNNLKPYYWKGLYQMDWFGQEVTHWRPLPEPPEEEET